MNLNMRENNRKLTLSTKIYFGKYKNSNKNMYTLIKEDVDYCKWLIDIWTGEIDSKVEKMFHTFWKMKHP